MSSLLQKTSQGFHVPDHVEIPYIQGDGIGPEVWQASQAVFDAAIQHVFKGQKKVLWKKVLAAKEAFDTVGNWLPDETIEIIQSHLVAIKGPLETPVGGGVRSINVALRQTLDLYACVRPVKWYPGVPSPVKHPEDVNMVIFRENTEDIYAGIEWNYDDQNCQKLRTFLKESLGVNKIRFPETSSIGIKPISKEGSERLIQAAIEYAFKNHLPTVTIVHKGNIQKFTEGGFRKWGMALAQSLYGDRVFTQDQYLALKKEKGQAEANQAWEAAKSSGKLLIQDCIADAFFQESLLNPKKFDVVACTNLNGDYVSDALAAQVGGIGISPGANINYNTGHAVFEATHGTAPTIAGKDLANPSALLLSGVLLFDYIGWTDVARCIEAALEKAIQNKTVTSDFNMENATIVGTKAFSERIISHIR